MKRASCCFSSDSAGGLFFGNFRLDLDGKVYRPCDEAEAMRFLVQCERTCAIASAGDRYLRSKLGSDELPGALAFLHRARCIVPIIEDRDSADRAEM